MTLAAADVVACEDTRNTGMLLSLYSLKKPLLSYHDHNEDDRRPILMQHLQKGEVVVLVSDAGMPLIADPGYKLVRSCREEGYEITIVPGANAALTALVGSGLPTDRFLFVGFLPPKTSARQKTLLDLKTISATHIFYESPQRLGATLEDMVTVLGPERQASVARELTKLFEATQSGTLRELAAYYHEHPPKGEIVIVVSPPDVLDLPVYDLDALLKEHLQTLSVRDAVAAIVALTGLKKTDVYKRALHLSGTTSQDNL